MHDVMDKRKMKACTKVTFSIAFNIRSSLQIFMRLTSLYVAFSVKLNVSSFTVSPKFS